MTEHILHFNRKRNYQRIAKDKVVRLRYLLRDRGNGQTLAYRDDMYYLHGGYGSAFPKIEQALEGLETDMKVEVDLDPAEGYGDIDPALQLQVAHDAIPTEAHRVGAELEAEDANGRPLKFRVVAIEPDGIRVDANHPMAGKHLSFVFEVLDIRDAHPREIAAGYAFPEPPGPDA